MHIEFWFGKLNKNVYSENLGVDGRLVFKMNLREVGVCGSGLDSSGS
jgi:hypothetical protein